MQAADAVGRPPGDAGRADAPDAITALYQAQALSLTRLAHVMLGDKQAAEDVVQEAFCGLYRRWEQLADRSKAPGRLWLP